MAEFVSLERHCRPAGVRTRTVRALPYDDPRGSGLATARGPTEN